MRKTADHPLTTPPTLLLEIEVFSIRSKKVKPCTATVWQSFVRSFTKYLVVSTLAPTRTLHANWLQLQLPAVARSNSNLSLTESSHAQGVPGVWAPHPRQIQPGSSPSTESLVMASVESWSIFGQREPAAPPEHGGPKRDSGKGWPHNIAITHYG